MSDQTEGRLRDSRIKLVAQEVTLVQPSVNREEHQAGYEFDVARSGSGTLQLACGFRAPLRQMLSPSALIANVSSPQPDHLPARCRRGIRVIDILCVEFPELAQIFQKTGCIASRRSRCRT